MPPSASNKRARASSTSTPSPQPPSPRPRTAKYHKDFEKTPRSDIILESSNGWHFATSKIYLVAASSVFEDTLLVGSEGAANTVDSLPLIVLPDHRGSLIRGFLSFVQTSPQVEPPLLPRYSTLDELLQMADKYDAPLVGRSIASHYFPILLNADVQLFQLFAVALIHSQFRTRPFVEAVLVQLGNTAVGAPEVDLELIYHDSAGNKDLKMLGNKGFRPFNLEDLPFELLERINLRDIVEFTRVRDRAMG